MGAIPTFDTAPLDGALAASILDWWHDAGVDLLVEDEARDWAAAEPARVAVFAPAASPAPAVRRSPWHPSRNCPTRWRRF